MKSAVFRISALATTLGVAVVVATGGRACAPRTSDVDIAATTATAAASAAPPPPAETAADAPRDEEKGVFGPSTKADPHAIRRAVQGLAQGSASAAQPTTNAPR